MSRIHKFTDQSKLYFVSFATVHWIDVFTRRIYKDVLVDSLRYCQENKGLEVYAWCIMTNHVHLIIGSQGALLQDIMRDFKRYTAKKLLKTIEENQTESRREWILWMMERVGKKNPNNEKYQFWQQNNHPILIQDAKMLAQKLDYLHNNPVEAGFVDESWEYTYSSAKDYAGKIGLLDIIYAL
jgi:putative transposase